MEEHPSSIEEQLFALAAELKLIVLADDAKAAAKAQKAAESPAVPADIKPFSQLT